MKKLYSLIILLLITAGLQAQTQISEIKTVYRDTITGKLYWNKKLPVYLHLSTTPNGEKYKLNSDVHEKYTNPFYFDTEGINYMRTQWAVDSTGKYYQPKTELLWEVYADSRPPKTKIEFIASESYTFKDEIYYSDDLKIKLTAFDELSGVKKIYYSVHGRDYQPYIDAIAIDPEFDIVIKFYSVDNVGNVEKIEEIEYNRDTNVLTFSVDNKAPVTKINVESRILSPKDEIILTSSDVGVGVNGIFYKFDTLDYKKYEKPIKLSKFKDGEHIVKYYSLDWINNKEEENEIKFYLDSKPPEVEVFEEVIKDNLTHLRFIELNAYDNKSGVDKIYVQLEKDGEYVEYEKPFYIDIKHQEIKIKAIDFMGNESIRVIKYSVN